MRARFSYALSAYRTLVALTLVSASSQVVTAQFTPRVVPQAPQASKDLERIGVDEHLGASLPRDVVFRDQDGKSVKLGDYFDGKRPLVLTFAYHTCPVLCGMVLGATEQALRELNWSVGREYQAVTISIDPDDTPKLAASKRDRVLRRYRRASGEEGWHFLVGDQAAIDRVTKAAGFRYFYDQPKDQYGHPAVMMIVSPEGKLSRYLYGLKFDSGDVRLGLLEASKGNSISTVEKLILYCYRYDPSRSKYVLIATRSMQIGGGITLLVLATVLGLFWRKEFQRSPLRSRRTGGVSGSGTTRVNPSAPTPIATLPHKNPNPGMFS